MVKILDILASMRPLFYVTRDIERAIGVPLSPPFYFIISNFTPFSKTLAEGRTNILLVESEALLDTHELLNHKTVQDFITKNCENNKANILVFKNTAVIEKICADMNWHLLNPSAKLSQTIEEKISQVEWLDELRKYLPPHKIQVARDVVFDDKPFILQFNRAHTGLGTMLITSEFELADIQNKFPDRPVRITQFIDGPMLTSNNVVCTDKILLGNISYQITGTAPFTDNPFTTIGNDWSLPHTLLDDKLKAQYHTIATNIGNKLREFGWKGLFGIDVIFDTAAQKLYLIEINARQPASTTYESILQEKYTTFEAHLAALTDAPTSELTQITDGAQIIVRNSEYMKGKKQENIIQKLTDLNLDLNIILYTNTVPGSDWIRIQTTQSLFTAHNIFNDLGEKIKKTLEESL